MTRRFTAAVAAVWLALSFSTGYAEEAAPEQAEAQPEDPVWAALNAAKQPGPTTIELLGAIDFNSGKRYADFDASTDKVAAYGLAALVGGVAAKKLGLLAVIGAFLLKFAKLIFIAVVAAGGAIVKFFKGKKEEAETAS